MKNVWVPSGALIMMGNDFHDVPVKFIEVPKGVTRVLDAEKDDLLQALQSRSKLASGERKGIITLEEAIEHSHTYSRIDTICYRTDDMAIVAFIDDYCFGTGVHSESWVHSSSSSSMSIVARPLFPNGRIEGVIDMLRLRYGPGSIILQSVEQYVDFVLSNDLR